MELHWQINSFDELSTAALYAILQLRSEVFVVEQNCVYLDTDNKDAAAFHLSGWKGNEIAAYCRVLPPGLSYPEASIGRVATSLQYRRFGYGRELVTRAVGFTLHKFECNKITISAQVYLKKFYQSLGFVPVSEIYQEDQIPHIKMQFTV